MLKLVSLSKNYKRQLTEMMDEWWPLEGDAIVPYAIRKTDYRDFERYLKALEVDEDMAKQLGIVPDVTLFAYDTERDIFVGAVNIRKYLNEKLLRYGGHIGDGIRPSERGKGYATEMVRLAVEKCREMGISRVLMTCDKENYASARVIMKNGGVLENEIADPDDGELVQRYWIELEQ